VAESAILITGNKLLLKKRREDRWRFSVQLWSAQNCPGSTTPKAST